MAIVNKLLSVGTLNAYYKDYKENKTSKSKTIGLANKIFGNVYTKSFDLKIKVNGKILTPQILQASEYGVDPTLRGFSTAITYKGEKPFFREQMAINEKDRMELNELENKKIVNDVEITAITKNVLDHFANFLYSIPALQGMMAGQFLSTGQIKIIDNGIDKVVDYHIPNEHKETKTTTAKWDASTTATPLKDLYTWKEKMSAEGIIVEFAVMNSATYNLILQTDEFKNFVNANGRLVPVVPNNYKDLIESYTGLKIVLWDEFILTGDGITKEKVFPDKIVTLLPSGELGNFEFAPTPDLSDKNNGILPEDVEVEFLVDSYASIKTAPQISKNGGLATYGITLSTSMALNPTCIEEMVILKVAD